MKRRARARRHDQTAIGDAREGRDLGQCKCGFRTAEVTLAIRVVACLPSFRRIDPMKPDALEDDVDAIAINDGGPANDRRALLRRRSWRAAGDLRVLLLALQAGRDQGGGTDRRVGPSNREPA
jgi:hypothetical protein